MFCDAETSQKTLENWKESKRIAKLGTSMFCDAEAVQNTWENWKESKIIVRLGRCFVTLRRVKNLKKLKEV